ncbi:related to phosphatase 2a inhibitor [Lecanosticta acicola]|uniref:Related to phosphatase 2a inhibitor n=1 Tax=Lecanosticta acicola TaxID=111012 RepID=A0AAI8YVZ1_9PEZI|nr:related to phosphatase 2a inhibitor [Lecanosticta acicola]
MAEEGAVSQVSYEDLAQIEDEFEEIDLEHVLMILLQVRHHYELSKPAFAKRAEAIAKIPNFWPLVFEQAPPEIDQFIQPSDSRIFAESLLNLSVTRPELPSGHPRSLSIRFEFKPNDFFEETVLEKHFSYRRAKDGWAGLVSEPVKITWKKGQDLTEGLVEDARKLFEARKGKGDMLARDLPEYQRLKKQVEHLNGAGTSFFTWFGFVSGRRWVSAEESEEANREHQQKKQKEEGKAKKQDEKEDEDGEAEEEDDDDDKEDDSDVEVHEAGEELATFLAEDLWPNAIKFFTSAQEIEEMSDIDFEEMDEDEGEEEDDDDNEPVDIRALVSEKGGRKRDSDVGPPKKKAKK